jgi:uncharacterized BrkB/YihY/UPF0761 family membrane protein
MYKFWFVLRQAVSEFLDDHGMKLSASLSYYTIFSLGPVLTIIISLAGIFFGKDAVHHLLFRGGIYQGVYPEFRGRNYTGRYGGFYH